MTWYSDPRNQQKKTLMGVLLLLATFPPTRTWTVFTIQSLGYRIDHNPAFYLGDFFCVCKKRLK